MVQVLATERLRRDLEDTWEENVVSLGVLLAKEAEIPGAEEAGRSVMVKFRAQLKDVVRPENLTGDAAAAVSPLMASALEVLQSDLFQLTNTAVGHGLIVELRAAMRASKGSMAVRLQMLIAAAPKFHTVMEGLLKAQTAKRTLERHHQELINSQRQPQQHTLPKGATGFEGSNQGGAASARARQSRGGGPGSKSAAQMWKEGGCAQWDGADCGRVVRGETKLCDYRQCHVDGFVGRLFAERHDPKGMQIRYA